MISIIVSTYQPTLFENFTKNIELTVGIPFEIISFANNGEMGLCELYNKGIDKAKYDFICFAHEDIQIKTQDWGLKVVEMFQNNNRLGLLGIAGSTFKLNAPSGWGIVPEAQRANFIQHYKYSDLPPTNNYINPKGERLSKVVCIDGVWMCTKKSVTDEIRFDEKTFKSFHCYDLDFSLMVFQKKFEVAVTFDILIEHFSEGHRDSRWVNEIILLQKKWCNALPFFVENLPANYIQKLEQTAIWYLFYKMQENNLTLPEQLKNIRILKKITHIGHHHIRRLRIALMKQYSKKGLKLLLGA